MATRCGDIDPAIVGYLVQHCGLSLGDVDGLLNKRSGFAGLAGAPDLRAVLDAAAAGEERAAAALEVRAGCARVYVRACVRVRAAVAAAVGLLVCSGRRGPSTTATRAATHHTQVYVHAVRRYLGAYMVQLNGEVRGEHR